MEIDLDFYSRMRGYWLSSRTVEGNGWLIRVQRGIYTNNKKIIVGESNCYSIGRNYNKMAILSEMLKGKKVVIMNDVEEEYKSLLDVMETDNNR